METRDKLFTEEQYRKQLAGYSKRCKQLESSIMEIINAEKEHIQLYSAPNSNVAYNKTVTLFGCKIEFISNQVFSWGRYGKIKR